MSIRSTANAIMGWIITIGILSHNVPYGADPGCFAIRPYAMPTADSLFKFNFLTAWTCDAVIFPAMIFSSNTTAENPSPTRFQFLTTRATHSQQTRDSNIPISPSHHHINAFIAKEPLTKLSLSDNILRIGMDTRTHIMQRFILGDHHRSTSMTNQCNSDVPVSASPTQLSPLTVGQSAFAHVTPANPSPTRMHFLTTRANHSTHIRDSQIPITATNDHMHAFIARDSPSLSLISSLLRVSFVGLLDTPMTWSVQSRESLTMAAVIASLSVVSGSLGTAMSLPRFFLPVTLLGLIGSFVDSSADYDLSEPQVAVNRFSTCYAQYGQVFCWGDSNYGQLGGVCCSGWGTKASDLDITLSAIDFGENFIVKQLAGGSEAHYCVVSVNDRLKCWGYNDYGQLGYGDTTDCGESSDEMGDNLLDVDLGADFVVDCVALGRWHTCAISTINAVKCFGRNRYGELGIGDDSARGDEPDEMGDYLLAVDFPTSFTPVQISLSYQSTFVLSADGQVCGFGYGNHGQLGQGNNNNQYTPVIIDLGDAFQVDFIKSGCQTHCAIDVNGLMKCWGRNDYGQCGYAHSSAIGDQADEMGDNLDIVDLGTAFVVKDATSGRLYRCVLSTDGRVKCFGLGTDGQLGIGSTDNIGSDETGDDLPFVEFDGDFFVSTLATDGGYTAHNCALSVNQELECWGDNSRGEQN